MGVGAREGEREKCWGTGVVSGVGGVGDSHVGKGDHSKSVSGGKGESVNGGKGDPDDPADCVHVTNTGGRCLNGHLVHSDHVSGVVSVVFASYIWMVILRQ